MLYNILKDQWQTIEIDRIRSITQETEFSQMAELLYDTINRSKIKIWHFLTLLPVLSTDVKFYIASVTHTRSTYSRREAWNFEENIHAC